MHHTGFEPVEVDWRVSLRERPIHFVAFMARNGSRSCPFKTAPLPSIGWRGAASVKGLHLQPNGFTELALMDRQNQAVDIVCRRTVRFEARNDGKNRSEGPLNLPARL